MRATKRRRVKHRPRVAACALRLVPSFLFLDLVSFFFASATSCFPIPSSSVGRFCPLVDVPLRLSFQLTTLLWLSPKIFPPPTPFARFDPPTPHSNLSRTRSAIESPHDLSVVGEIHVSHLTISSRPFAHSLPILVRSNLVLAGLQGGPLLSSPFKCQSKPTSPTDRSLE